jgi:nitroimidazol reductase NimA-like FMN-containing flavoprotein (pyridoxamine 5'-phosphate oxidase superfamily)
MAMEPARSLEQRKRDVLHRFEHDIDAWVATADEKGEPYLVPLCFLWHDGTLVVATPEASPTGLNLGRGGPVRLAIGETRDVVMVEGTVRAYSLETVPEAMAEAFASKLWDARREKKPYGYYAVTPHTVQAWREVNELSGRDVMRDGRWVV